MTAFALFQIVLIGSLLFWSIWRAFRILLPGTSGQLLTKLSTTLDKPERSALLRWFGCRLRPADLQTPGCGTTTGCGNCAGCSSVQHDNSIQALHIRP